MIPPGLECIADDAPCSALKRLDSDASVCRSQPAVRVCLRQ